MMEQPNPQRAGDAARLIEAELAANLLRLEKLAHRTGAEDVALTALAELAEARQALRVAREALEFYAAEGSWEDQGQYGYVEVPAEQDGGEASRAALQQIGAADAGEVRNDGGE